MYDEYFKMRDKYSSIDLNFTKEELLELYEYMYEIKLNKERLLKEVYKSYLDRGYINYGCPQKFTREVKVYCRTEYCKECWRTAVGWYRNKNNYWRID